MRVERRFRTDQPGIVTFHGLSSGAHHEPDAVAFGPIVGVDEHLVEPGAGFDWHAHRGVQILSWVLEGVLRHKDSHGDVVVVPPGQLLVQSTGSGIRHTETNASAEQPLRFLQLTLLADADASVGLVDAPAAVAGARLSVAGRDAPDGPSTLVWPADDHALVVELLGRAEAVVDRVGGPGTLDP